MFTPGHPVRPPRLALAAPQPTSSPLSFQGSLEAPVGLQDAPCPDLSQGDALDPATRAVQPAEERANGRQTPRAARGRSTLRLPALPTITRFCLVDGTRPAAFVLIAERIEDMLMMPNGRRAGAVCLVNGRWTTASAHGLQANGEPISECRFWALVEQLSGRGTGITVPGRMPPLAAPQRLKAGGESGGP